MRKSLYTPKEIRTQLADRVKALRIARGFTQKELAKRAGISYATYRLFEQEGKISLSRLIGLAFVVGDPKGLLAMFPEDNYTSLDDVELMDAARQQVKRSRHRSTQRKATP